MDTGRCVVDWVPEEGYFPRQLHGRVVRPKLCKAAMAQECTFSNGFKLRFFSWSISEDNKMLAPSTERVVGYIASML